MMYLFHICKEVVHISKKKFKLFILKWPYRNDTLVFCHEFYYVMQVLFYLYQFKASTLSFAVVLKLDLIFEEFVKKILKWNLKRAKKEEKEFVS